MRLFLILILLGSFVPLWATSKPKLVVTILVDQLRSDYLERFNDDFVKKGFRLYTEKGAFMTRAQYDYSPTVTGPGHASFLSGASPRLHGIIANSWFDKRTGKMVYCCGDDSVSPVGTNSDAGRMSPRNFIGSNFSDQMRLHYQSKVVGISIKDRGAILPAGKKPTGAFWFESDSGNFISSSYYGPELPQWVQEFNERRRAEQFIGQTWDRLLDPSHYQYPDDRSGEGKLADENTSTFPHKVFPSKKEGFETILPTPFGNQILMEFAKAAIEGEKLGQGPEPDVLCISFSSIDTCGHKFGPYSQEMQDITLRLDRQLAELFAYLDKKVGLKHVVSLLTADHGVAPTPEFAIEQGFNGKRLNDKELVEKLLDKLKDRFGPGELLQAPRMFGYNFYFNHDTLRARQISPDTLSDFIREWALSTGLFLNAYKRDALLEGRVPDPIGMRVMNGFNAERSGDIVLVPKPYIISSGSNSGTTHGSPYAYDTHVPVAFFGAPFKAGRYADDFYVSDIAATLSAAMHINQPPLTMGKPLVRALSQP